MAYRMTPARRAALKKAQAASARKRKGRGKAKSASVRRRKAAPVSGRLTGRVKNTTKRRSGSQSSRKKTIKRAALAVGAVSAVAGAGYVYKNREKLIIGPAAVRRAVKDHKANAARFGRKLESWEIEFVREQEKIDHANRSVFRVRNYLEARRVARLSTSRGKSLRPDRKNNAYAPGVGVTGVPIGKQRYYFESYRRDVYSRAVQRLARMKGKKRKFGYDSGKRLLVDSKGKVKRTFW